MAGANGINIGREYVLLLCTILLEVRDYVLGTLEKRNKLRTERTKNKEERDLHNGTIFENNNDASNQQQQPITL